MKILFITSTRIGDAILSTCIPRYFETYTPEARFTIACSPLAAPLFEDFPALERLIILPSKKYGAHWWALWKQSIRTPWDLIIDLRGSAISFLLWSQKRLIWRSKNKACHRVEQLYDFLNRHGFKALSPQPYLWISSRRQQSLIASFSQEDKPIIAIAPLANWPVKEWPASFFLELLEKLRSSQGPFPKARITFLAGPHEQDRLEVFKKHFLLDDLVPIPSSFHLLDVAGLLERCNFFIGNDSGLMHMAAALGVPTIGLFGPSNEVHYRPWGPKATYIRTPASYPQILEELRTKGPSKLMESLTVEAVYQKVQDHWIALKNF